MANPGEQVTNRHSEAFAGGAMAITFVLANFSQFQFWLASRGVTQPPVTTDFKLAKELLDALYQVEQAAGTDGEGLPERIT